MSHFNEDIHQRTSLRLSQILPDFIKSEYPIFVDFLKGYYEFLEQSDTNPIVPVYILQSGTVTITAGDSTVRGSGTTFNSLKRGQEDNAGVREFDRIQVAGETFTIRANTGSQTELILLDIPERTYYGSPFYLETQKSIRQASGAIRQLLTFHDYENTLSDFIVLFQDTFLRNFPQNGIDYKILLPKIFEFYQSRGSEDSFRFIFRALFGEEILISYPRESVFTTSEGTYERPVILRLTRNDKGNYGGMTFGGETSGNVYALETRNIIGLSSNVRAYVSRVREEQWGNTSAVTLNLEEFSDTTETFEILLDTNEPGELLVQSHTVTITSGNNVMVATGNVAAHIFSGMSLYLDNLRGGTARVTVANVAANGTHLTLIQPAIVDLISASVYRVRSTGGRILTTSIGVPPNELETEIYTNTLVQDQQPGTAFFLGERISTLPLEDPLRIEGTVLGSIERIEIINPGTSFQVDDYIYVPTYNPPDSPENIDGVGATAKVTSLIRTEVADVNIINGGGGYYEGLAIIADNTGTGGSGFAAIVSKIKNGANTYTRGPVLSILLETSAGAPANVLISSSTNWNPGNDPSGILTNIRMTSMVSNVTNKTETVSFLIPGKPSTTLIGEIEGIEVISSGINYFKPPALTVQEPLKPVYANQAFVPQSLLNTGKSAYVEASIEPSVNTTKIATLQIVTGGAGYTAPQTFTINSSNRLNRTSSFSGTNAELRIVPGTVVRALPRAVGERSQTSGRQYLQDDSLYQPFAYVLSTKQDITVYEDTVRQFLHPAGGKLVPDRMINVDTDAEPIVSCSITRP